MFDPISPPPIEAKPPAATRECSHRSRNALHVLPRIETKPQPVLSDVPDSQPPSAPAPIGQSRSCPRTRRAMA